MKCTVPIYCVYLNFTGQFKVKLCAHVILSGQGHAADGEAGGGDGPQTSHSGLATPAVN